jgi:L-fuculose-phosphate aldolase
MNAQDLKAQIRAVGKRLYQTGLALAHSGNISARLDDERIVITATGTFLGALKDEDIVTVALGTGLCESAKKPSSELALHCLIYKNFPAKTVIHCHPPLINGYFAVCQNLKALTFETKFYLGDVPVVKQETPTVTDTQTVIDALKSNNLVVLKNHGAVAIGDTFESGLSLIETLEEAVKVAAVARLFQKDILDDLDSSLKDNVRKDDTAYPMFSRDHIQAIVDLVNRDEFIAQKGKDLDLTVKLAIKLDGEDRVFKFDFQKGKVVHLGQDLDAPFVISAPRAVWEQVFLGNLDSFVAVTQGKMKLQGQLGQLSRWYVPFTRLFELFKMVKFK